MSIRIEQTDIGVDDWIDGATFIQVKVDIHRNPAVWADLGPLYAQIDAAEQRLTTLQAAAQESHRRVDESALGESGATSTVPADEASLGETPAVPQTIADAQAHLDGLIEQAEALYAQYDADKEIWTLRALEPQEVRDITAEVRADLTHGDPPVRRAKETARKYDERVTAWTRAMTEQVKPEVDVRALATAVVGVNVAGQDKPAPSLEAIRRLRKRPHGEKHFAELVAALEAITLQEVAIPAPHRRGA